MNEKMLAVETLMLWERKNIPIHILVQKNIDKLSRKEAKAQYKKISYGVIEEWATLNEYLLLFLKKPEKTHGLIKNILRVSAYQKYFLENIPDYAIAHEMVEITKKMTHKGHVSLVNAIIQKMMKKPLKKEKPQKKDAPSLAAYYNYQTWMVEKWIADYGADITEKMLIENAKTQPTVIRANALKMDREQLQYLLRESGILSEKTKHAFDGLICQVSDETRFVSLFSEGYFSFQDEASMLLAQLIQLEKGMLFLDMCCSPGGKLAHVAERFPSGVEIYGYDVSPSKVEATKENLARLGIDHVQVWEKDSRKIHEIWQEKADFILLDAPCSGTGVIGRKPDIKWRKQQSDWPKLQKMQFELLESAYLALKPGGKLIYSTCSIEKEENAAQYEGFLQRHKDMRPLSLQHRLSILVPDERGAIQILPHEYGTDGFFISFCEKIK